MPVVLAASVDLGGVVAPAHRNYRPEDAATLGSTTRSIAVVPLIRIGLRRTDLAVRLAGTHWPTVRQVRDNRLAGRAAIWLAIEVAQAQVIAPTV